MLSDFIHTQPCTNTQKGAKTKPCFWQHRVKKKESQICHPTLTVTKAYCKHVNVDTCLTHTELASWCIPKKKKKKPYRTRARPELSDLVMAILKVYSEIIAEVV